MNRERLFIRTIEDLDNKLNSTDDYEILMIAGLLRKLLLDGGALLDQINSRMGLKIRFVVNNVSLLAPVPGAILVSVSGILNPNSVSVPTPIEVTKDKLFAFPDLPPQRLPLFKLELPVFLLQEQVAGNQASYEDAPDCTPSSIAQSIPLLLLTW